MKVKRNEYTLKIKNEVEKNIQILWDFIWMKIGKSFKLFVGILRYLLSLHLYNAIVLYIQ